MCAYCPKELLAYFSSNGKRVFSANPFQILFVKIIIVMNTKFCCSTLKLYETVYRVWKIPVVRKIGKEAKLRVLNVSTDCINR